MAKLIATPHSALVDEPVHIQVTGLAPFQVVCLQASLKDEKGNLFGSKAYYKASETGEVDLERDPSLGGDYLGVHPMGLFWSMKPEKMLSRLAKRDVNIPYQVHIELCEPHFPIKGIVVSPPMDSLTLERWYVAPGVTRIPVKEGRLRGALFLPQGEQSPSGCRPCFPFGMPRASRNLAWRRLLYSSRRPTQESGDLGSE